MVGRQPIAIEVRAVRLEVLAKILFLAGLLLCASGYVSTPVALIGGIVFGLLLAHPYARESRKYSKLLLQVSVVLLGFAMNLNAVIHAGRSGFLYTAIGIVFALGLGTLLGRLLRVEGKASFLISAGTAICGGSAIAALAPITEANEEEISVSMGTVFLLNSIALLVFPAIGWGLHLSQSQFGLWAALAIHDTSSVVGATAKYGAEALAIGTTVKLARALWIVPLALVTASVMRSKTRVKVPWFIFLFCGAAALSTYLPQFGMEFGMLNRLGRIGLTVTLFLIGTSLSKKTLQQVGARPLVQGVLLWLAVGGCSLLAVCKGWIAI